MSEKYYKPVPFSDRAQQHRRITSEQARKFLASPKALATLLAAGWDIRELRRMADIADEPERDESPTFDVSGRWDGGLHNRPHDERNPE